MSEVLLLNQREIRECVTLDTDSIDVVENAFASLARGKVVMPPILRLDISEHNGEVDVKTAYLPDLDYFAIKVSPGFFNNPGLGLPSLNGMMMLLSGRTGLLQALLLDNGYLTAVRTAAAGAVAARWLARQDSEEVALLGAGEQAELQLKALLLVRDIKRVRVWARSSAKAQQLALQLSSLYGLEATAAESVDEAMSSADIAVTCTPSNQPILHRRHLRPGLHITAMGADTEHKNEVAPEVIAAVDHYVADRVSQTATLGELHHAINAGVAQDLRVYAELGQVILGDRVGRLTPTDVTLCDLTGTGVQDTAIANLAFSRAISTGKGLLYNN
ncbi:ectoine utilization protein EutC [Pseudomonas fulva]|uniref:ectoine utilization protein EutC n=1 Tax=Pseudomonas fulva TaxID=47880 RepID=UPI003EED088E